MTVAIPERNPAPRPYCPGCEPLADVLSELLDVRWCDAHLPGRAGVDDALAASAGISYGSAEAGGEGNRLWCDLIHRSPARPPARPAGKSARRRPP